MNKEQTNTLKQQIQTNDQDYSEQKQRKEALEKQLEALTTDVSGHEETEESLQKQIATLTEKKMICNSNYMKSDKSAIVCIKKLVKKMKI
ncbi:hypothetical protein TMUPMC115_2194 [Tetragenococcus muriaticus PMC-11-5]|uniref:Uncharacterized protein n=1 Tax=Tetragenococcus muriaticus PMC-11-5 TaxID=1302649 RepID=A0A091BZ15_9ENTE|nr:hypothetical protein TMUPMC115_2194 [Tetragenococcus muriaticus PMC-11-5]